MISFTLTILSLLIISILRGQQVHDLRLVNNEDSVLGDCAYYGRVEIYFDGRWGTICDDGIFGEPDNKVLEVICNQLGYSYEFLSCAQSCLLPIFPPQPEDDSGIPIWLDDVVCNGTETNLNQCEHRPFGEHGCTHNEDIKVLCGNLPCSCGVDEVMMTDNDDDASIDDISDAAENNVEENNDNVENYDIRLVNNGSSELGDCLYHGRVEIYFNGTWGTICDDGLFGSNLDTYNPFDVICNQLGYSYRFQECSLPQGCLLPIYPPTLGDESGIPIWLSDLVCNGTEANLNQCEHSPFGTAECAHNEDIKVVCANLPCSCSVEEEEVMIRDADDDSRSDSSDDSFDAVFVRENDIYSHQNQVNHDKQIESVTIEFASNVNIVIIIGLCLCLFTLNAYLFCFYSTVSRSK